MERNQMTSTTNTLTATATQTATQLAEQVSTKLDNYRSGYLFNFTKYQQGYNLPHAWVIDELLFQVFSDEDYSTVEFTDTLLHKIATAIEQSYRYEGTYKDILSEIWDVPPVTGGASDIWTDLDVNAIAPQVIKKYDLTVVESNFGFEKDNLSYYYVFEQPIKAIKQAINVDCEF